MTTDTTRVDELLDRVGKAFRAAQPPLTEEEAAEQLRRSQERLAESFAARLKADNEVACHLCLHRRQRQPGETGLYYDCRTCPNVRKFWHFRRDFSRPGRHDVRKYRVRQVFSLYFRLRPARCRCK